MKNRLLLIVLVSSYFFNSQAFATLDDFERGYNAGILSCSQKSEFWTCSVNYKSDNSNEMLTQTREGSSRAETIEKLFKACTYISNNCIIAIRSGLTTCKNL